MAIILYNVLNIHHDYIARGLCLVHDSLRAEPPDNVIMVDVEDVISSSDSDSPFSSSDYDNSRIIKIAKTPI